jgi:hypothetical protein
MPHPNGEIKVEYATKKSGIEATIRLPASISGTLLWQGKSYPLHEGAQKIELPVLQPCP